MENQKCNPNPSQPYPWYDDRVTAVRKEYVNPWADADDAEELEQNIPTPQEIYGNLDRHVWKQDEAKKAAAVIMYQCLRGIKSNAMFIGPSGCGKTHIWRCLKGLFPSMIDIRDSSSVTLDGWKGSTKFRDLLCSPIFRSGHHTILVMDEADKMLSPKFTSGGNNASLDVQGEALTLLEGSRVDIKIDSVIHSIDTSKISFVLCGAFSNKAHDVAEKSSGSRIGFGAAPDPIQPYVRPLDEQDLIDFGVMPEFMGRIQRIVNLQRMTTDDYYRMTDSSHGFLARIGAQYKADIRLTPAKRRELAEMAVRSGLGVRGIESQIRRLIDDAIFDNCEQRSFEF